jgi:hypothetical protein
MGSTLGQAEVDKFLVEDGIGHLEHDGIGEDEVEGGCHCVHLVLVKPCPRKELHRLAALPQEGSTTSADSR